MLRTPLAKYNRNDGYMIVTPAYCNTKKKIDDFISLIRLYSPNHSFNFEDNAWVISLNEASLVERMDHELYPNLKDKMDRLITPSKKIIKDYEDMGTGMKLSPYGYQKEIIKFIVDTGSSLVVSPCGSGKTPIGIGAYLELHNRNIIKGPGMIVVKASLKNQWAAEVKKFSDLEPAIIESYAKATIREANIIKRIQKKLEQCNKAERISLEEDLKGAEKLRDKVFKAQFENADLFIVNYETLKDEQVKKTLKKIAPQYIFADEAHYIKDPSTARNKALCSFNKSKVKIAATATPVQKDPRDIYGLFKFINPSLFKTKTDFEREYVRFLGGMSGGRVIGAKNEAQLNKEIEPYMVIKTKEEVSKQLPSLVVIKKRFDLDPKQQQINDILFEELEELHEKEKSFSNMTAEELKNNEDYNKLSAQVQARQTFAQELTDSEKLLSDSDSNMAQKYVSGGRDIKLDVMTELVEDFITSGEKVCIFSRYTRMQSIITDRLYEEKFFKGFKIAYINGAMSSEKRFEEIYTNFTNKDEYKVLIMSDAGAEGVNLSSCKYLIEMEPAESYAKQTQRHGRLERADSIHDTVFVYQLIANNSWDEIGLKIISKKERYDNRVVKGIIENE